MKRVRIGPDPIYDPDHGERVSDKENAVVARALEYPYQVPTRSFLQVGDQTTELPADGFAVDDRQPVLALGSNAAPSVLRRKLGESADDAVPALLATLSDFDIVYSAHISAYGSIPATIQASPGTEVTIFVIYLTDDQLRLMSRTEPNYHLALLQNVNCRLDSGASLSQVASYVSRHGCLTAAGTEVALDSVSARRRRFPAMTEPAVLDHVRSVLSGDQTMTEFIEENVRDRARGKERTRALAKAAKPFAWTDWEVLNT
jgi:hypothetical protein